MSEPFPKFLRYGRRTAFANDHDAAKVGIWFMAHRGNEAAIKVCDHYGVKVDRAQSGALNSAGGALVPEEMMEVIINLRELAGAFRAAANIVPMSSDLLTAPRRIGGLTAYFTGENQAITESQAAWDGVKLSPAKLATLTRASSEFVTDAAIDIGNFLASEAAYAFALKEDSCGFYGDGTSSFNGTYGICPQLLDGTHNAGKVVAATGHDTFAEVDTDDVTNLMAKLPAIALPGARWFVSQFGFARVFCRLAAVNGGIVMMRVNGVMMPHFLGFPVQITQVLPQVATDLSGQVMMLFGDLNLAAMLGERRGVRLAISEAKYIDLDQVAFKVSERVDINVHDLGDNTTAGPIVGLVGE
jgi:HK97 family phage major capsid protein